MHFQVLKEIKIASGSEIVTSISAGLTGLGKEGEAEVMQLIKKLGCVYLSGVYVRICFQLFHGNESAVFIGELIGRLIRRVAAKYHRDPGGL